jgi:hypothetical protein
MSLTQLALIIVTFALVLTGHHYWAVAFFIALLCT